MTSKSASVPGSDFFGQHAMTSQASDLQQGSSVTLEMTATIQWLSDRWTAPQGTWVEEFGQLIPQSNENCVGYGPLLLHISLSVVSSICFAGSESLSPAWAATTLCSSTATVDSTILMSSTRSRVPHSSIIWYVPR